MKMSKKVAVISAVAAVAVPGVAQATHETGKAGAPGQVCRPLLVAQKEALKGLKGKERAAMNKTLKVAYKGCIQGAAKARSADQPSETPAQAPAA